MPQVPIQPGLFTMPGDPRGPRLLAGQCQVCRQHHFPASTTCPYCSTDGCRTTAIGATGTLYVYTVVTARPPGYRGEVPYGFGVVDLPEGLRVISRLAESRLDELASGLPLELEIAPLFVNDDGDEVLSYAYKPLPSTAEAA
jgi:uncharacterized OB-fold protein